MSEADGRDTLPLAASAALKEKHYFGLPIREKDVVAAGGRRTLTEAAPEEIPELNVSRD